MNARKWFALFGVVALVCMSFGIFFVEPVQAQNDSDASKSMDKDIATRRGISGSLASGDEDEATKKEEGPSKLQMGLGVGSVFVAIIVCKWL